MKNVLNLLNLLGKTTFFKCTKNVFIKKRKSGHNVLLGHLIRHLWLNKDTFIDVNWIELDSELKLGMTFLSEQRKYEINYVNLVICHLQSGYFRQTWQKSIS